jgi:cellulose synthase/poly-beta-1,6-N-acetylglucosamine synthase-like glycosyltransferase
MPVRSRQFRDARTPHRPLVVTPLRPPEMAVAAQDAVFNLRRRTPELSAAAPSSVGQMIFVIATGFGVASGLMLAPYATLGLLHALALWGFTGLAFVRLAAALTPLPVAHVSVASETLPMWTVLVAVYDEADVVAGLVAALDRLDWPIERLEILLLVEADDISTRSAIARLNLTKPYRVLAVPFGEPRTKPRALNVGLAFASGQFVTVYDAEDRPSPAQLRAAHSALTDSNQPKLACVQSPLTIHNAQEGWLTAQFALEYAIQFQVIVPALVRFGWPVPLGGTSNHFRCDVLRKVGGWDPYNVTEDADLGIRLLRSGWKTGYIRPETLEEAPPRLRSWLRQRSRWLKGHAQTLGVHTRYPIVLLNEIGPWAMLGLVLTLGGTVVSALLHGPLALAAILATMLGVLPRDDTFVLLLGIGSSWVAGAVAAYRMGYHSHWIAALTMPLYWPFQTLAAVKALHGLVTKPFEWDKTAHGQAARQ